MNAPRPSFALLGVLAAGVGLPVVGSLSVAALAPQWRWAHEPFHAVIEGSGGFIALAVAGLLVNRLRIRGGHSTDAWVAAALAAMGFLDVAHAAVRVGEHFVWFHSLATLAGGVLFAMVATGRTGRRVANTALALAVTAVAGSLVLSIPAMVVDGEFTALARGLNIVGGLGFYVASVVFMGRFRNRGDLNELFFSGHCALFGSAGVLFELSTLWDGGWWWWHGLRLAAYGLAVAMVAADASRAEVRLVELNDELDRRNEQLEERIAREMDRRRQLEEQRWMARLEHTQKLESLGVLAGGIAHDFNNLLVGILGNSQLALRALRSGPAKQSVERIEAAARRAADLTRQMLAFSGKGHFVTEAIDLNAEVEEMGQLLTAGTSKKATMRWLLHEEPLLVEADRSQLQQVVMNLITNASDALEDQPGVITLRTGVMVADADYLHAMDVGGDIVAGRYAYLEVSDTGCGMNEATRARMFDPFYTTKSQGRGLGMAATLGIVRGHHGAMQVTSEPGQGTTIKLLLPILDGHGLEDPEPSMPPVRHGRGGLVLVVDDEEAVRDFLDTALPHMGYEALLASDGHEALSLYRARKDDLCGVILDVTMPNMSGEEVFRELTRISPDVRVLVSSGFSAEDISRRFPGKGLRGFIQKPYRLSELGEKLRVFSED
jgi:signal transduction histidine kinase